MISSDIQKLLEIYSSKIKEYIKAKSLSLEDKREIGKEFYRLLFINKEMEKEIGSTDKKKDAKDAKVIKRVTPSLLNYQLNLVNESFKNIPIGVSVDANEDLLPYLISASSPKRATQWVLGHDKGMICLGVLHRKEIAEETLFNRIITEVIESEEIYFRGNVFVFNPADKQSILDAIKSAVNYLNYYDIAETKVLHNVKDLDLSNATRAPWMHENTVCVIPEDLSYLGDIFLIGRNHYAVSVHNINRGISVCIPQSNLDSEQPA